MSKSSDMFLEHREKYNCIIEREFYESNLEILKDNVRITKTIIEGEDEIFKNDTHYNILLANYKKANKDLRDYKYNKQHNFKK